MPKRKLIIARNEDGWLCLYTDVPWRDLTRKVWTSNGTCLCVLDTNGDIFPEVTWQTEPVEVEIIKKEK